MSNCVFGVGYLVGLILGFILIFLIIWLKGFIEDIVFWIRFNCIPGYWLFVRFNVLNNKIVDYTTFINSYKQEGNIYTKSLKEARKLESLIHKEASKENMYEMMDKHYYPQFSKILRNYKRKPIQYKTDKRDNLIRSIK